ncbi:MAG: TIGR01458 family HAD-type hydrolase [Hydrogenovibrio sp.]|nr:TIGR01458 family HAD-type hydrolase [Hydrogenovibrio sp.]
MTYPESKPDLSSVRAILLDISGVLYEGHRVIPGAVETVNALRKLPFQIRFVTNTSTKSSEMIRQELLDMGFEIEPEELFTAPIAAKRYLIEHLLRPFCLLHPDLKAEFADIDQEDPNCVLLGDARDELTYENLNHAFQLIEQGHPLLGIGKNKYFMSHDGLMLDSGVYIHALEWASNTEAIILGKPDHHFFQEVVLSTGCRPGDCLMIGDDVVGDIQGAIDAGLQACLVKTGKFKDSDLALMPPTAHLITTINNLLD